eukprot:1635315-Pyramimonas_sp.AAC.4
MAVSLWTPYVRVERARRVQGAVWYQGENNMHEDPGHALHNTGYACMLQRMLRGWREAWHRRSGSGPELPFGIVTLAAVRHTNTHRRKHRAFDAAS